MKLLNKIFSIAVAGIAVVGCNDLDTAPMGSTITSDQREEVLGGNPAMAEAGVNTIASNFKQFGKVYADEHTDFGYPSIMLALDVRGADMVSAYTGYNRYYAQVAYSDITAGSSITNIIWYTMYKQIYACNSLISSLDKESTDKTNMFYLGQAYAVRAFDYHVLAQLYQHTYLGNETKP
ncbi:RagB/SusD family nutrient uptake outer membrane protein, partial [uncultured Muribaculum sp.]